MPETEKSRFYRFDEYLVDTVEESLSRNGEKVIINRRTFQVLRLLVERAGRIVGKQEFFDTVWANTFVADNSLTVTMTALRKILGDDSKQPKFIENLPRKGYRFIGDVEAVGDDETLAAENEKRDENPSNENEKSRKAFKDRKIFLVVGAGCLLLLSVVLVIKYRSFTNIATVSKNTGEIKSVAVLPFQNQNPDTEYLSDGLTDNLINDLSEFAGLRVISRDSAFRYKGTETDSQVVGRELNVDAVLTGRFVERGDDLIVSAELVDARDERQIWGRQYNRKTSDAFALQREISRDVSETLRLKLTGGQTAKRQTDNPEAFQLYLKGRYQWNKRTSDGFGKAIEFFKQAIDKDPTYAPAYVGLADTYLFVGSDSLFVSGEERVAMVNAAANKALEIDPTLGEAHATLAINLHFEKWDWTGAKREYQRAVELSPNYATAHHWYAEFLATEGRFDESFAEYKRALELDPLSLAIKTDLGMNYYYARQPERAIEYLEKLKAADPNYLRTHIFLGRVYEDLAMFEKAIAEQDKVNAIEVGDLQKYAQRKALLENALKTSGAKGYWRQRVEFVKEDGLNSSNAWLMVKYYSKLGERDEAWKALERFYNNRQSILVWLKVSPEFDGVRSDARFADLMRRVGLPQ